MQVHHLRNQSATDDADAETSLCQAARDYTPVIDGRSIRQGVAAGPALTASIVVANAPVSFGAFEVTVGIDPHVPDALTVLDAVQRAGYAGIDLGPPGYLGTEEDLRQRLSARGLGLAGGYVAMPFSEPDRMGPSMDELARLLDIFDQASSLPRLRGSVGEGGLPPRPTLADAGSDSRRKTPGRAHDDPSSMLDSAAWSRFAESMKRATGLCRERGYEPTFHHHGASYVETPEEIEEMLHRTDVGLCLDTGHLLIGGGDPITAAHDWAPRINHLHLKDVRRAIIDAVVSKHGVMMDFWREGAFCPLGEGDLDIDGVLNALRDRRFSGWLVVEQDMLPRPDDPPERAAQDQQRNREYLRARGL
jgi:inosose dehydratase